MEGQDRFPPAVDGSPSNQRRPLASRPPHAGPVPAPATGKRLAAGRPRKARSAPFEKPAPPGTANAECLGPIASNIKNLYPLFPATYSPPHRNPQYRSSILKVGQASGLSTRDLHMSTLRQIEANRRNSQKSTGP